MVLLRLNCSESHGRLLSLRALLISLQMPLRSCPGSLVLRGIYRSDRNRIRNILKQTSDIPVIFAVLGEGYENAVKAKAKE
eukprot:scaffold321852_cov20-Prasinocladus_malaysianus.AAC.1